MSPRAQRRQGLSARDMFLFLLTMLLVLRLGTQASAAQAALLGFLLFAAVQLWFSSRRLLENVQAERQHAPRVFMEGLIEIRVVLSNAGRRSPQMLLVEDQFGAGIEVLERHLITELHAGWEVEVTALRVAERHRGLYLLGPLRLHAADPLGVFQTTREIDVITRLTVYPSTDLLPAYQIPGPAAGAGPSLDVAARIGLGDEILSVREYTRGDPPSRIHGRTSARRGEWHVTQLNRTLQTELCVMLDLTRLSRYGLGRESTTEAAIGAATSILSRGQETRHRLALSIARESTTHYPPAAGLPQYHMLVDRLAIIEPLGEADFWTDCAQRALMLAPGSRLAVIQCFNRIDPTQALTIFRQLVLEGVQVDLVMIDDSDFIRIYKEQETGNRRKGGAAQLADFLRTTGAKVWVLTKDEAHLKPDTA